MSIINKVRSSHNLPQGLIIKCWLCPKLATVNLRKSLSYFPFGKIFDSLVDRLESLFDLYLVMKSPMFFPVSMKKCQGQGTTCHREKASHSL